MITPRTCWSNISARSPASVLSTSAASRSRPCASSSIRRSSLRSACRSRSFAQFSPPSLATWPRERSTGQSARSRFTTTTRSRKLGPGTISLSPTKTALPPAIKIDILSDRTPTIRAAITDVQHTLILAIALVVVAIFIFLRTLWATVIPGVTVPLAIVGTFALIYVFGYSLDNLSLMALTIAVGFVVDDAIVMIENIERHVEAGLAPMEAAAKGAGEIAFTIVSISLSLIAVFIPLLLMGGVVGRLFREFAVTVTITILVSALVSLSLSPMMCSRLLHDARHVRHGRLYMLSERGFDLLLAGYRKSLDLALRHQPTTLGVFLAAVSATGYLFVTIPKGFFPQQDTGLIIGVSEAAQDVSFAEMSDRARALSAVVSKDPAVASVAMNIGAGPR